MEGMGESSWRRLIPLKGGCKNSNMNTQEIDRFNGGGRILQKYNQNPELVSSGDMNFPLVLCELSDEGE